MVCNKILSAFSFIIIICCMYTLTAANDKFDSYSNPKWNLTEMDHLRHKMLKHYDKYVRPTHHYNTTSVSVGLNILHIELNEFKNTFTVHGSIRLMWNDEKLKWNASDYNGLSSLHVSYHEIWQPDIVPSNGISGSTIDRYGNTNCLVMPNGVVVWVAPIEFIVFCDLDLHFWPFDTQICSVQFSSCAYDANEIDLKSDERKFLGSSILIFNSEWNIVNISHKRTEKMYKFWTNPYYDVTFYFEIERRSPTYLAIIIAPAFAVITMILVNFCLPSQANEKIFLHGCTAIIICMFLLFFSQKCPAMGDNTPLIVSFYRYSLYAISFSMIASVIPFCVSRTRQDYPLLSLFKNIFIIWSEKCIRLYNYFR